MEIKDLFNSEELKKLRDIFWGGSSFLSKCTDNKTGLLPSISELILLLNGRYERGEWHSRKITKINASKVFKGGVVENLSDVAVSDIEKLYNSSYTLCFGDVSHFSPSLEALKKSATSYFGGDDDKVLITCYLSPPNSAGILHYDRQHNFFIQREGAKKWTVSERAAVECPYDNLVYSGASQGFFDSMDQQDYRILKPNQCGKIKYDISPNNILYIPPGFYHVAETDELPSLHYTLTLEPLSFWSEINPHIFKILLSNCQAMNKDIRLLPTNDAKNHFEDCIRSLKDSLPNDLAEGLFKSSKNSS